MKKVIIISIICLIVLFAGTGLVWADDDLGGSDGQELEGGDKPLVEKLDNPLGNEEDGIYVILGRIIKALLGIVGSISLLMFIYGGITLLTSAGASEKIKKGQQTLVWASLGILVVFASYAVLKFVFSAFGL